MNLKEISDNLQKVSDVYSKKSSNKYRYWVSTLMRRCEESGLNIFHRFMCSDFTALGFTKHILPFSCDQVEVRFT